MNDVEKKIMIGESIYHYFYLNMVFLIGNRLFQVTHWQHPRFHAYFPAGNSYPSILGDMLGDAIGCVGFSWAASPACTELVGLNVGKSVLWFEFLILREGDHHARLDGQDGGPARRFPIKQAGEHRRRSHSGLHISKHTQFDLPWQTFYEIEF